MVLIARALARAGYTVSIVDADSTNVGLHQALGVDRPPSPLIDYFGGMIFSGGNVTCPVDDPTPLEGAELSLDLLSSDFFVQPAPRIYLLLGGKLGEYGAGAGCDGPITKIARDIYLRKGTEPVVTLVDFKAGLEDTARGVAIRMDWAIVIVDPTQASITLAGHMKSMVEGIRAGQLPATHHLESESLVMLANRLYRQAPLQAALFVLNRIADPNTESFLRRTLAAHQIEPVGVIHNDSAIGKAWLTGTPIDHASTRQDIDAVVRKLERFATDGEKGKLPFVAEDKRK